MGEDAASTSSDDRPRRSRGQQLGRRGGQVVYYGVVAFIAVAATYQIGQQVFYPSPSEGSKEVSSCQQGLRTLLDGIDAGKRAALNAEPHEDEEAALDRFRLALAPAWQHREAVGMLCSSKEHKQLLVAIDRLRYSEEHGVRRQAAELTALRRRVGRLAAEVLGPRAP